jgi:hypothetical protein
MITRRQNKRLTSCLLQSAYLAESLSSWLLIIISLPLCALVFYHTADTLVNVEQVIHVEDLSAEKAEGISVPEGYHVQSPKYDTSVRGIPWFAVVNELDGVGIHRLKGDRGLGVATAIYTYA